MPPSARSSDSGKPKARHNFKPSNKRRNETLESQVSYTGISDIILQGRALVVQKRGQALCALLSRKLTREDLRRKSGSFARWRAILKDLETAAIKWQLNRLANEVEALKVQEKIMRTTFRV